MKQFMLVLLLTLLFVRCGDVLDMDEPGNLVPKTVNEDLNLPSLLINGSLLHFETMGDIQNPILIFNHGGPGGDYRAMISQKGGENASRYPELRTMTGQGLSQLQDEYFCVFYDQRGGGLSPRFDEGLVTMDLLVEDLDAIIEYSLNRKEQETGIRDNQVYMLGWSFGGVLATRYINEYPEKVRDVIFYEPGPFAKNVVDYFIENTTSVFGQIGDDWLEEFLLAHDHITADDHERADYMQTLGAFRSNPQFHEDINTPFWRFSGLIENEDVDCFFCDSFDFTSNLINFEGTALFMFGELTITKGYPQYPALQTSFYENHETVVIPTVGHTGPWEKADEIAGVIRDFINSNQSTN